MGVVDARVDHSEHNLPANGAKPFPEIEPADRCQPGLVLVAGIVGNIVMAEQMVGLCVEHIRVGRIGCSCLAGIGVGR